MRRKVSVSFLALFSLVIGLLSAAALPVAAHPDHAFHALVFTKTTGFRHDSIPTGIAAVQQLGADNNFAVDTTEDATAFNDANLANYDVVIWLSTTGDVLNDTQQAAFERYIQGGGGYAGIHAAADTEYDWPWYGGLVGAWFNSHPANQTATINVSDRSHPSTAHLPAQWERHDEWYNYRTNPRGKVHVLATLDERTYDPGNGAMGADHPTTWCQNYDGGRSWYTGGGHTTESYSEPQFLQHILGGIQTAAGAVDADCGGTDWDNFDKVALDTGTSNPMELDVADDGRVFYIERSGEVRAIDPDSGQTVVAGNLDVYLQREDGLLGLALDPDFVTNNRLYLYYSPNGTEGKQRLSRFTMDGNSLDMASEKVLLEIPVDREKSGHAGGSLAFGADGNLYIATGDDTNPFESDGYAPTDERPGRLHFDAQRSSANTNDLRGKVLRIHPEDDGTYTVPEGNLFAPGTAQTRPEVYAMGFRNPFRIQVDPATGALMVADYGPDANEANPERGTEGRVEWNRITAPGNFGWPYCHGGAAFRDYDFATGTSGPEFDCASPVNDSPHNTGLTNLPPVVEPDIYYGRSPQGTNTPVIGTGGGPMAGPVYQYDPALQSDVKWPAYYDKTAFLYEWTKDDMFEIRLDGDSVHTVNPLLDSMQFLKPMDMTFGPDGAMYLIEWGSGFGGDNTDSGIYRVEYTGGLVRPDAEASANPSSGSAPLDVAFSSEGSGHPDGLPVTYHWTFGDGAESTEANPTHTYTAAGTYTARLTVTAEDGTSASSTVEVTAGNTEPLVTVEPPADGGFFDFGDAIPYAVDVSDAEDGSTGDGGISCQDVGLQVSLGHDTHAHPEEVLTGCEGVVQTHQDGSHPPGEDLFYVLEGRYTDRGGAGVDPLTGRDLHVLHPKTKQAEHFSSQRGIELETTSDPKGGGQNIGFVTHGDHIAYERMNLAGIDELTYRVASGGTGGRIEVHADSPDGPLVSDSGQIDPTGGWQQWTNVSAPVTDPGGTHDLYFVFLNNPGDDGLFNLNHIRFRGRGVSQNARPEIHSVSASPTVGEQPTEVTFSADATDPENEDVTYEWDFGDGATAVGPNPTHTYELSGVYEPTVTVTDASGASATDFVRVEVVPEPSPPIECDDPNRDAGYNDEFEGDRLDGCRWDKVVRPNLNRFRVEGGHLKIDTTATNLFDDHNNAPNLMLQSFPTGDWAVETKVSGNVCERWQQGGILAYASDETFLKIDYVGTSPAGQPCKRKIEMRHEIGDVFQPAFPEVDLPDNVTTWWLRLEKTGDTFTGYYSADGVTYEPVGSIDNDQLEGADVGLYAFGQEQTESTTVAFDYFHKLGDEPPADETAPTVSAVLDPAEPNGDAAPGYEGTYNTPVTVTLDAADEGSGVDTVEYAVDGGAWTSYSEPVTVAAEGAHTVDYRATDQAGNVSAIGSESFEIKDDACPGSDLRPTVVMRAVDSGVANRDRGDGCTVEDLIEDEQEWPRHGRFMRHVRTVTDRLVRADVITRRERGDLLDAAGRSSKGGQR
jgi:cytochrome c